MDEHSLIVLLAGLLYVLWLAAGLGDYLCHRRTDIAATSGVSESWLHFLQFLVLGLALLLGTLFAITPLVLALIAATVAAHSVLAFFDVSYTQGRRFISPLEQHVHGYMEVLPVVAVGLLAVLNWGEMTGAQWILRWKSPPLASATHLALLGSFFVLAGAPIVEELIRTSSRDSTRNAVKPASRCASTRDRHITGGEPPSRSGTAIAGEAEGHRPRTGPRTRRLVRL